MYKCKKQNPHICIPCKVDASDELVIKHDGIVHKEDHFFGEVCMKTVGLNKYLGDIIS